jgi:hypothetical protein
VAWKKKKKKKKNSPAQLPFTLLAFSKWFSSSWPNGTGSWQADKRLTREIWQQKDNRINEAQAAEGSMQPLG